MTTILDYKDTYIGHNKVLADLWATRPVLLVFLRRLGCAICRAYVEELKESMDELTLHMDVAFLSFEEPGTGSDEDRSFSTIWNGPLYSFPKKHYKELFGKKFFDGFYGLADMDTTLQKKHKTTGNYKGDGFVLGGQSIVVPGGQCILEHRQSRYGDDVSVKKILTTIQAWKGST